MGKKKHENGTHPIIVRDSQVIYQICVKGLIDERWSEYLSGFSITHLPDDSSLLVGAVRDQSALFGVLIKIRDLGISLISIKPLECVCESNCEPSAQFRRGGRLFVLIERIKDVFTKQNEEKSIK